MTAPVTPLNDEPTRHKLPAVADSPARPVEQRRVDGTDHSSNAYPAVAPGLESTLCVSKVKAGMPVGPTPRADRVPVLLRMVEGTVVERFVMEVPALTIGRDPVLPVVLDDGLVSRRHAQVAWENQVQGGNEHPRCKLLDLNSRNGTFLNREPVPAGGLLELSEGDRIQIGSTSLLFYLKDRGELEFDKRLANLATQDSLTGMANRSAFLDEAVRAIQRAQRYGRPLCLSLLDIDHFKLVNDTYGHDAGDTVLRRIGWLMTNTLRDVDVVGRLGGEEFAILMPESALTEAHVGAERVRRAVESAEFPHDGRTLKITASQGLAKVCAECPDWESLYKLADARLYEAKHAGRNRVVTGG